MKYLEVTFADKDVKYWLVSVKEKRIMIREIL